MARSLEVQRVRHASRLRMLQVARVQALNPHMVRVTLEGDELAGFQSASFDDHLKVFFPAPSVDRLPEGEPRPIGRDITPRRYDAVRDELDLEFVLHDEGPAASWARQAAPGQYLGVGGPRGSMIIPTDFDWHLLIGDETALPAIARRLEELPAHTRALVMVEVADASAQVPLESRAEHYVSWCHRRGPGEVLMRELRRLVLPGGEGFVWAAGESAVIREARDFLCNERGVDKRRIRAASYWKRGAQDVHERMDD
jgi:NADPH-dependent ferric siderophore reductase